MRSNTADTKEGVPGAGAEIPLQQMVEMMVMQVVPLQPMNVNGRVGFLVGPLTPSQR